MYILFIFKPKSTSVMFIVSQVSILVLYKYSFIELSYQSYEIGAITK